MIHVPALCISFIVFGALLYVTHDLWNRCDRETDHLWTEEEIRNMMHDPKKKPSRQSDRAQIQITSDQESEAKLTDHYNR